MNIFSTFIDFITDTVLAPACAQDPCSNAAADHLTGSNSFDHSDPNHLHDVQYAAEQNDLWCSAGADAGPGIDYTCTDLSDGCGSYGDWHQL